MAELVINADDFGRSTAVNRAVIKAHRQGVLNSASLMVAGEAADDAVRLAHENPTLKVGLHVVAVDGPAVLPHERIPHITDRRGWFANRPVRLGLKYALHPHSRAELKSEIQAQFERFAQTGLPLNHVDGHQHMHMHPAVFGTVLDSARQYGAQRIRIVRDELRLALGYDKRHILAKLATRIVFAALKKRCNRLCHGSGLQTSRRTYGLFQSGHMDEAYVLEVLKQAMPSDEIYFHPCEGERSDELGPNPQDLATLLSPAVARAIDSLRSRSGAATTEKSGGLVELQVLA